MNEAGFKTLPASLEEVVGKVLFEDIYDEDTGEVICLCKRSS